MAEKIIRSHRARVKKANLILSSHPRFSQEHITLIDREAFVEFFLLEDIVRLYEIRLNEEKAYIPHGRADEKGKQINMRMFTAIIDIFEAAIGVARTAINSGNYKKVWKAIPERPLMIAANTTKRLPELRKLAVELLYDLSDDMMEALSVSQELEKSLDALEDHEENVSTVKGIPMTMEKIEEVIRAAEDAIPDRKRKSPSRY